MCDIPQNVRYSNLQSQNGKMSSHFAEETSKVPVRRRLLASPDPVLYQPYHLFSRIPVGHSLLQSWICSRWERGQLDSQSSGHLTHLAHQQTLTIKNAAGTDQLSLTPWGPTTTSPVAPPFPEDHTTPKHRDPKKTPCKSFLVPSPSQASLLLVTWSILLALPRAPGDAKQPVCTEAAQGWTCKN